MSPEDLPDYHLPRVVLIDHVKLVDLISEITLIGTINKILQIDNISSVDLIDEITLIDTINTIAEITHISLIDAITEVTGINSLTAGEKITNGGFETGDLTGWTGDATVTDQYAHSGTYSVLNYSTIIQQTLAKSIPKSYITSFGVWAYAPDAAGTSNYVDIGYSDGTYTRVTIVQLAEWAYYDLLAQTTEGKCVSYVLLRGGSVNPWWGDDVSLVSIGGNSIIDVVKEVVKITSMPDITVAVLPDVIIRDATESTQKLAVDADGKITVNIPDVTQSDESLLKATVTQAAKDRTVTGTVTSEQSDKTLLNANVFTKHDNKTYKTAVFDASVSGNLVAAVAAKVIKLHALTIQAQGTVVVNLNNGAAGTSLMEWSFQAREGAVIPMANAPSYWAITSVNTALYVTLSAAVTVTITAIYSDDDVS